MINNIKNMNSLDSDISTFNCVKVLWYNYYHGAGWYMEVSQFHNYCSTLEITALIFVRIVYHLIIFHSY